MNSVRLLVCRISAYAAFISATGTWLLLVVWLLPDALEFVEAAMVAAIYFSSSRSGPGGRHAGAYFMKILISNPQATNDAPATSNIQIRYKKSVKVFVCAVSTCTFAAISFIRRR